MCQRSTAQCTDTDQTSGAGRSVTICSWRVCVNSSRYTRARTSSDPSAWVALSRRAAGAGGGGSAAGPCVTGVGLPTALGVAASRDADDRSGGIGGVESWYGALPCATFISKAQYKHNKTVFTHTHNYILVNIHLLSSTFLLFFVVYLYLVYYHNLISR